MTIENGDKHSSNQSGIWRFVDPLFGMSQRASPLLTVLKRSLNEDYPLWIASFWILWKQEGQSRKGLPPASSLGPSSMKDPTSTNLSLMNIFMDAVVLGSLLIYKKTREETRHHFLEKSNDSTETDETKSNSSGSVADAPRKISDRDSIQELRTLLNQHSADSSKQVLAPTRKIRSSSISSLPDAHSAQMQPPSLLRTTATSEKNSNPQRYVELMVHNVSHTDLVLSLDAPISTMTHASVPSGSDLKDGNDSYCLCRPRFSAFDAYSQRLLDYLKECQQTDLHEAIIRLPWHERNGSTRQPEPSLEKLRGDVPIGFKLQDDSDHERNHGTDSNCASQNPLRVSQSDLNDLRVRGRDAPRVVAHSTSSSDKPLNINAIFFPLLATLMPLWESRINEKYSSSSKPKQVLILVSGVGQPRNWTHSVKGNSTQQCAELMKIFLKTIFPDLVVVHIHSDTNIFRYDENIAFVQQELLPRIQEYRDAHAQSLPYPDEVMNLPLEQGKKISNSFRPFSTEWRKSFSITLSFADGSPARNHAIQAALRTFKPTYYHFWQLKTFWHESKIVSSDVEVHSFEEMETLPPVESNQLQDRPIVKLVVEEMKKFRDDFTRTLYSAPEDSNDIRAFWLRKTRKPVIAVLAVQPPNGKVKLYRGTNMEVSMPTGSLCAERNVIGTALADNPSLKRQDLKMVAVLAVPNPNQPPTLPSTIQGGIPKSQSTNSIVSLATATIEDESSHGKSPYIPSRKSSIGGDDEEWIVHDNSTMQQTTTPILDDKAFPFGLANSQHAPPSLPVDSSLPSTPVRRIYLYNKPKHQTRKHRRAVVVHSEADINPLRPCGACNEWLKKVAESNPYFTVITFTDSNCNGVYCTPCEE